MMFRNFLILLILPLSLLGAENIKAVGAVSKANIKAIGAVAEANVKAFGAVDNTASGGGATAPEVESSGSTNFLNNAATTSTNIVTTSGSNRALFVKVGIGDVSAGTTGPTGVTYGGVAMTKVWQTNAPTWVRCDGFVLANPASGANSLIVTYNATLADQVFVGWVNLTNVHQTVPVDAAAVAAGSGTAPSVTVSSAVNDLVLSGVVTDAEGTLTVNVGTQILKVQNVGPNDTDFGLSKIAGSASVSPSWTTGNDNWAIGGISFNPP